MAPSIILPHHEIVIKWKEEKVIKWLRKVHLDDCIPAFEARHIDGKKLLELTEQKLFTYQDLRIKHRTQIAKCVQECKSQATNAKRVAKTLKKKRRGVSASVNNQSNEEKNGIEYDYDSDDWGSDFDDSDEDVVEPVLEVNNNIPQIAIVGAPGKVLTSSVIQSSLEENSIPKPPDISVVSKTLNGCVSLRNPTNAARFHLKRPPSQPPPPPNLVVNQEETQEDYEIPITSSSSSVKSISYSSSSSTASNEATGIETYEIIDPPEENYEIVDSHSSMANKPILPPRHLKCPTSISPPPPLPQKPPKLKDTNIVVEKVEGVRTFSRPKPTKAEVDVVDANQTSSSPSSIGSVINNFIGRKYSAGTLSSPPKNQYIVQGINEELSKKFSNENLSLACSPTSPSTLEKKKPVPPLPPRGLTSSFEETCPIQNIATRPLPPVPICGEKPITLIMQDVTSYPWFHEIEREEAEETVKRLGESGSFVVRPSKRAGKENPYSVTVLHEGKLFHLNIRLRSDGTFALGKEKENEKAFTSVPELIAYHQKDPIHLKNRGEPAGKTILGKYPEKS